MTQKETIISIFFFNEIEFSVKSSENKASVYLTKWYAYPELKHNIKKQKSINNFIIFVLKIITINRKII